MRPSEHCVRKFFRGIGTILFVIVGTGVFLALTASPLDYRTARIATGPHKVNLTTNGAAKPHGLVVSETDTVTWCSSDPSKPKFKIEFKHGSPFTNGKTVFTDADCDTYSAPVVAASAADDADVYKYSLTIYGKTVDPHVIVVGGGPSD
jgi:hypothetical protein